MNISSIRHTLASDTLILGQPFTPSSWEEKDELGSLRSLGTEILPLLISEKGSSPSLLKFRLQDPPSLFLLCPQNPSTPRGCSTTNPKPLLQRGSLWSRRALASSGSCSPGLVSWTQPLDLGGIFWDNLGFSATTS